MLGPEMHNANAKIAPPAPLVRDRVDRSSAPSALERDFACQLAASVWLLQLGEDAAVAALSAYAIARSRDRAARARLRVALETEYQRCLERLDLCS